jgi:hypothetical protein
MSTSITQLCNGLSSKRDARRILQMFQSVLADVQALKALSANALLNSGALAIHGSASALAKTAATVNFRIGAAVYSKVAADMAALAGTVTNAKFNVFVFMVNAAGTLTSAMGTEGATLAAVVFPTIPSTVAVIGYVIINPTGTGDFVGGTTALDDATVVPGAIYVNTVGPFGAPVTLTLAA